MVGDDGEVHASEEYVAFVAHETANSSCSMITYRDLASERNRDPACTVSQASACCCWRMKPSPWQLASVHRRRIEVRQGSGGREGSLSSFEDMLKIVRPNELVPGAEEWA